ncbi:MAG: hypothetical protein ACPGU4_05565 [Flavobacteriales bacterium]
MRFFLSLTLALLALNAYSVDFTKISRDEPVSTVYPANFKCYVDVSLFLDLGEAYTQPAFLRVSYIIGNDTLNDNMKITGSHNAVIKQFFLDEGERLTVAVRLNNGETNEIEGVEGALRIVRNPDFVPVEDQGKNTFLSNVWKSDQTPLFRVGVKDSIPQLFRFKLSLNENFEFDKFYFKVKVISPSAGILMLDEVLTVTESPALEGRNKTFSIDLEEIDLETPGSYYFQVMQNMLSERVNGIEKIEYEIVPQ